MLIRIKLSNIFNSFIFLLLDIESQLILSIFSLRSSIASKQFDTYGNQSNIEYNDNENSQADFNYKDGKKLKIEL